MAVTNIITLNQLYKMFNDFQVAHFDLEDFGVGPTSEIGVSRAMEYPYMWITHRNASELQVTNKTQIPELNITAIFVDQINDQPNTDNVNGLDSDNQQEITSDTFQYAQDFIGYISSSLGQYGVMLTDDPVLAEPIYDETDDKVSGWIVDFTIKLRHSNCVYPMSGVTFSASTSGQPLILPATDYYTTGTTLDGTTLYFNRTDTLSAYTADLSSIAGGSGATASCATISACTFVQDIQNDITTISGDVITNTTNIANNTAILTGLTATTFYIGVNYQTLDTFTYIAPEDFKINSIDNPSGLTLTTNVNGSTYTLGNTISLYDELTIGTNGLGFIKLNCDKV